MSPRGRSGISELPSNETIYQPDGQYQDEYEETYTEPDLNFMYEIGTHEQVSPLTTMQHPPARDATRV